MAARNSGTSRQAPVRRPLNDKECDSDGWETASDGSIPDPDEIREMMSTGLDWKRLSKVVKGPICWKCFQFSPYFCCVKCDKHFHRKCAFMDEGYPDPIFDKSVEEAWLSNYGEAKLVKCPVCIVSEETRVETMHAYSKKELNEAFALLTRFMIEQYGAILGDPKFAAGYAQFTLEHILEKTTNHEYSTVEGYFIDYKNIKVNLIRKYARESEAFDVMNFVLGTLRTLMKIVISCLGCVMKSIDANGKLLNMKKYGRLIREPCSVPHLVIWVKEVNYPFWPAKVLTHFPYEKTVLVQYFGWGPDAKELPFPGDDKTIHFMAYSSVFPEKIPDPKDERFHKWKVAMAECNAYLRKMREKYGDDGVVIPKKAGPFNGNMDEYILKMFPKYVAVENKMQSAKSAAAVGAAEVPADQLKLGFLQIDTDDDLFEQADDDLEPGLYGKEDDE